MIPSPPMSIIIFEIPWFGFQVLGPGDDHPASAAIWIQHGSLGSFSLEWTFFPFSFEAVRLTKEDYDECDRCEATIYEALAARESQT